MVREIGKIERTDMLSLSGIYFLTAYYCIPFLMAILNPWIPAGIGLILIFVDFRRGQVSLKDNSAFILCCFALFLTYYFLWYREDLATSLALFVTAIISLLPCYMFKVVITRFADKDKRNLIVFIFICISFVMFRTLIAILSNPEVTRNISQTMELQIQNIAVFNYSYAFGGLFILFFVALLNLDGKKRWLIIGLLISLIFVFIVQYTSLLLLVIVSIIVYFILTSKTIFKRLIILLFLIILLLMLPTILELLIGIMGKTTISEHLRELYNLVVYGDATGDFLSSRENVYSKAFNIFLESPLFGVPVKDAMGNIRKDSAHSEFLASLSNGGIISFVVIHIQIYYGYKCLKKYFNSDKAFKRLCYILFLFCYLSGWLNNFSSCYELHFVTMFLAPLFFHVLLKKGMIRRK